MNLSTLVVGFIAFLAGILAGFYLRGAMERGRARRPAYSEGVEEKGRVVAEAKASLLVVQGSDFGKRYPLADCGLKVGRSQDNDLVLDDPAVSRFHVDVRCEDEGFYVCDLGSTNGTFVNGERISRRVLKDGDVIQIGTTVLRFCINP